MKLKVQDYSDCKHYSCLSEETGVFFLLTFVHPPDFSIYERLEQVLPSMEARASILDCLEKV
jgi:hypothetical protein